MRCVFVAAALAAVGCASAQYIMPNGFENVEGNSSFALTSTSAAGRTYQFQIHQDQLSGLMGTTLTGLQWRLNGSVTANWPSVDTSYSFFDVYIGPGIDPAGRTTTFANNFSGTKTQVRSGGLVFPANAFSATGSPVKPWGPAVTFTNGYVYNGGHLTIEMRFSAQSGATNQPTFDGCTSSTTGYGTQFAASWASSATATTSSSITANILVTNINYTAVPEPGTMAALGIGALALTARRRRKA